MKKIFFYILSIVALAGCMERSEFVPENSVPAQDMKEYVAPLELTLGGPQTKSYDEDLNWTWEESDKIYGYQVAGGKSVNTLTFVEDNRFGTPEFAYASEDAATFHFVYAGDATLDEAAEGNRGIRQDSRQSGEWRPVLVGSAVGKTISEVMNDEAEINMEHLSAALEVRLWKEGVDKANLTDADKKNIVYAELMSDTENFLLDIVPVYNQNGTVSYTDRERGEDEEDGGYIRTEYVNSPVAVFNVAPHAENYQAGALRLAIVDENGDRYVPALNFVAGQRTILNVEWKTPTSASLPDGETFNSAVDAFMTGKGITEIKFITNSTTTSEDALVDGSIYLVQNGETLEIHTAASQFIANTNCNSMFNAYEGWDNSTQQAILNSFVQIQTIDFGENFNTQNVTNMSYMFRSCSGLTSLDLSKFNTQNVTDMSWMFSGCSGLTSLDLSNFNTTNVTDMSSMFSFCSGPTSLDLSNFNTTNVTDMRSMFSGCSGLTSLGVSKFNTQNVTDMGSMFHGCSGLTSLDVSNFNTQNVTDMSCVFYNCSGLTSLDVINFNTHKVTDMGYMFSGCSSFTSLDISSFSFLANPSISNIFNSTGSNAANKPIPIYVSAVGKSYIEANGFTSNENCELVLTDKAYLPTGETFNITVNAFMAGKGITKIKFVTNSATTSEDALVGSSIFLVQNGETLEIHTHASQFVAHNDCQNMFFGQYNNFKDIVSIDLGDNFNTQNVTNMSSMFYYCRGLTSLDVSNFNTQNVTNMSSMFNNCVNITSLDVSKFNTQNVTDMSKMFYNCENLTSFDVSKFNTENVSNMKSMFAFCEVLTSLDISSFSFIATPDITTIFYYTGSNAANKPIPIYVTEEGKSYLETAGNSYIDSEYATLIIKSVGI